jgi:hypothetical protein
MVFSSRDLSSFLRKRSKRKESASQVGGDARRASKLGCVRCGVRVLREMWRARERERERERESRRERERERERETERQREVGGGGGGRQTKETEEA